MLSIIFVPLMQLMTPTMAPIYGMRALKNCLKSINEIRNEYNELPICCSFSFGWNGRLLTWPTKDHMHARRHLHVLHSLILHGMNTWLIYWLSCCRRTRQHAAFQLSLFLFVRSFTLPLIVGWLLHVCRIPFVSILLCVICCFDRLNWFFSYWWCQRVVCLMQPQSMFTTKSPAQTLDRDTQRQSHCDAFLLHFHIRSWAENDNIMDSFFSFQTRRPSCDSATVASPHSAIRGIAEISANNKSYKDVSDINEMLMFSR